MLRVVGRYLMAVLALVVAIALILAALGVDVLRVVPLTLIILVLNLVVALAATFLRGTEGAENTGMGLTFVRRAPDLVPLLTTIVISLTVAWLTATVLVVERAVRWEINTLSVLGLWVAVSITLAVLSARAAKSRGLRRRTSATRSD